MKLSRFSERSSFVHGLDPRLRIVSAFILIIFLAWVSRPLLLGTALLLSFVLLTCAKIRIREVAGRLAMFNLLVALFGFSAWLQGEISQATQSILVLVLRGNSMLMLLTALVGTMDVVNLGHALAHLHMPSKLAQLFLFTVRQVDLLHEEFQRLRDAMRARAFRPRLSLHCYRSLASLIGMILVRSLLRAEKVHDAMRCRCFSGHFYLVRHFSFKRNDAFFSVAVLLVIGLLLWGELR